MKAVKVPMGIFTAFILFYRDKNIYLHNSFYRCYRDYRNNRSYRDNRCYGDYRNYRSDRSCSTYRRQRVRTIKNNLKDKRYATGQSA